MKSTDSFPRQTRLALPTFLLRRYSLSAAMLFFVLMVAIGSIPGQAEALSAVTHDKFLHFAAYSVLSVLLYAGIRGSSLQRALGTLAGVALLGLLDETIQHFLHYRNSNVWDWLFNMLAAALNVTACSVMQHLITIRRSSMPFDKKIRRKPIATLEADRTN